MKVFTSLTLFLIFISIILSAQAQLQSRPDIQPLHPATLSFIHQRFPYVIVHFYDSRASKSKDHEDFMTMLSSQLPNHYPGVKLASFDIKANETARELFDTPQNNNLLFFIKGNPVPDTYQGDLTMEDLLDWLKYRIATKVIELDSLAAADELITSMDLVLIYFGSIYSDAFTAFVETMTAFNEPNTTFARTNDMGMMFEFGHDGESEAVMLFRNQDEERNLYTGPLFTMENLRAFVKIYKYPAVMTYSKQARSRLQTSREDAIVLFRNQDEEGDRLQVIFNRVAPEYREKMIFLYTESEESFGHSVAGYMNKEKTDYPMVVIISGQNMLRFVLDRDITERNLRIFIHNYFEGNLKHYLRSETIPAEEYEQGVKVLVGKNYWKTVLDEDKDVLVAFYSPDCPFSEDLFKFYPAFARKLKSVENLVIAKINNDMNDLEDLTVLNVPSLYFYPRGRKTRPLIQRRAGNMRVIVEFLQKHATVDIPDGVLQANKFANKVTGTR